MFAKGTRFPPKKPSDVPGPGAYELRDPNYDAYKHGAFLEKDERFLKEKPSDVPGPGAYNVDHTLAKQSTAPVGKAASNDRNVLLRKVEELERLYAESKKSHQAEMDRLKGELSRSQKTVSEQTDRIDKLKKQNDVMDARLQELKKGNMSDQSEIKDLRAKLRVSEHERAQLASKQGEASDAKKAMQALDARRRDEVRERDKKVTELEKALTAEKRRKEALEVKLAEAKNSTDAEVHRVLEAKTTLDTELRETKAEVEEAKSALVALGTKAQDTEEELVAQLEQHRLLLSRVVEQYGRLASSSISRIEHERVQRQSHALQVRVARLERKLANSEDQVMELAHLIRSTKEHSGLLAHELLESEHQLAAYSAAIRDASYDSPSDPFDLHVVEREIDELGKDLTKMRQALHEALLVDTETRATYDRARLEQLLLHSTFLGKQLDESQRLVVQHSVEVTELQSKLSSATAELSVVRSEQETIKARLADTMAELSVSQAREESLRKELQTAQAGKKAELSKLQRALREEREITQKLTTLVQTNKAAEDAFSHELEQITADLAAAEKYQEAYTSLLEEVDALVERNALAEDEAQRLSTFNAQILGHHNPAQRIMYVDRIRKELHDTKQELLSLVRERDNILSENEDLLHELEMYTSVVPQQAKPRTAVTRVMRVPLGSQSMNTNGQSLFLPKSTSSIRGNGLNRRETSPESDYKEGDMTLDELS